MFGISTLYLRLAGAAAIGLLVLSTWAYVSHLRGKVENLTASVELGELKFKAAQEVLHRTTQARDELDLSLKQAEVSRAALVKSYDLRLKKSRQQVPSKDTSCPKVIEWAIERAPDLSWEAK